MAKLFRVIETFPLTVNKAFARIDHLPGESYQITYVRGTDPITPKLLINGPAMAGFFTIAL